MHATFQIKTEQFKVDLQKGIDLSIPFRSDGKGVLAWYLDHPLFKPVVGDGFVGEVKQGGSVNFFNLTINPHGHGTHTECVGHISSNQESINQSIQSFFTLAQVVTVKGVSTEKGTKIELKEVKSVLEKKPITAIIIRTSPNLPQKKFANHSNSNSPYLEPELAAWLSQVGIEHLLIDQPSVDPEVDGGALLAHRAFWQFPNHTQLRKTITELIFVPDEVKDGIYILNLQVAPIENDAAPSRPMIYEIIDNKDTP